MTERFATLAARPVPIGPRPRRGAHTGVRTALAAVLALVSLALLAGPAHAAAAGAGPRVDIVKISGLIDPINVDLLDHSIRTAEAQHALLVVLQVNSTGGTVSARRVTALADQIRSSPIPVVAWVGGSGHPRAEGAAWTIVQAADYSGEGPGAQVGPAGHTISGDDAVDQRLLTERAPTLVGFLGDVSGKTLKHTVIDLKGTGAGFRKDAQFAFSQLSIVPKLLHTAASPDVAFVMLLIALSLVVFEFFTAGVGVAATTAVAFGVLSAYGLGVLPTRPYAVALVVFSVVAMAVDVQAGAPRFWTGVGVLAYVVGALQLYRGQSVSLWIVVGMGLLLALLMVSGMPAMIRTRFSTPTIGRELMVGTMGVTVSGVAPEGTVEINGAPWRARTNRATPIAAGEAIRVTAIDGLLLEVEPETGGARDAHH